MLEDSRENLILILTATAPCIPSEVLPRHLCRWATEELHDQTCCSYQTGSHEICQQGAKKQPLFVSAVLGAEAYVETISDCEDEGD